MRKLASIAASALVLAVIMVTSNTAAASDCRPDQLTVYDPQGYPVAEVWVWDGGGAGGFNWACFGPCGADEPNSIYYLNDITLPDPNMFGFATILYENTWDRNAAQGDFSDVFGVVSIDGNLYLGFNSGSERLPAAFGSEGAWFWPECKRCEYDATFYLDPTLQAAGYTAWFEPGFTPEPGTLMLLGAGLLGIASSIKRKLVK